MKTFKSQTLSETANIAKNWLTDISHEALIDEATIVGLSGHLGAGKTAFVKMVAKELGIAVEITSPTFVIMKIYEIDVKKKLPWKRLVHIDAYRLENELQLEALNWEQLVADKNNLIMMEWPENVSIKAFTKSGDMHFLAENQKYEISYK